MVKTAETSSSPSTDRVMVSVKLLPLSLSTAALPALSHAAVNPVGEVVSRLVSVEVSFV